MLDLKFIKENIDAVKENIRNRNVQADADKVVELYDARNKALQEWKICGVREMKMRKR